MGLFSLAKLFGVTIRESANDGSDFTNPDADYRRLFLGEDGQLHVKDSAGAVTDIGGSPSEILDIPTAETDNTLVLAPDGVGGVEFRAETGGGGGGLAHSFIGRNSVGGSWESVSTTLNPLKKVTLAADSTITAIEAYLRNNTGYHLFYGSAVIYADNSGTPLYPIFASQLNVNGVTSNGGSSLDNANPRWVKFACGVWLAAGDYWIGIGNCVTDTGLIQVAYDTTGGTEYHVTDQYWSQPGQAGATGASSVHDHSIRASILS